jgi:hypothetical protein
MQNISKAQKEIDRLEAEADGAEGTNGTSEPAQKTDDVTAATSELEKTKLEETTES